MKGMYRIALAAALAVVLAGCNTMAGVGRDVERGGEKMQRSSSGIVQGLGKDVEKGGQAIQDKARE
ncbi:MAG: entericidin A/B family lipoprotein [Betaproteobacteria bacterium]|nr:entericidin A/B family lipoprotein [Betaproteobacteria bacterium]